MKHSHRNLTLLLGCIILTVGCGQSDTAARESRLICFTINSPELLPKVAEIATHIASTSVVPGDRLVIIDSWRRKLLDSTVREPELLEPISDVRRLYKREVDEAISKIDDTPRDSDRLSPEQFGQGHLLLHVQREFSTISISDKVIVMVSTGFDSFPTVDKEDLAIYGVPEVIEDLTHRNLIPDLQGFRIYRTGPGASDINLSRIFDKFWGSLFQHAKAQDSRLVGWESVTSEIMECIESN